MVLNNFTDMNTSNTQNPFVPNLYCMQYGSGALRTANIFMVHLASV